MNRYKYKPKQYLSVNLRPGNSVLLTRPDITRHSNKANKLTAKLKKTLQQHEALVESGKISTFTAFIQQEGILIKPAGSETGLEVPLIQEMLVSLHAFFYGVESIEYGSFDYATLKGFINASTSLGRKPE
ncbi:hypothetical protein GCM10027443_29700 [Pontibacter brevis]